MIANAVSRSYVLFENASVPVYRKPRVKWSASTVKGGEGNRCLAGSPGGGKFLSPYVIS